MSWIVRRKECVPESSDMDELVDEFDTYEEASMFCLGKMHDHLMEIEIYENNQNN